MSEENEVKQTFEEQMSALDVRTAERDAKEAAKTFKHAKSQPYGEWGSYMTDVLGKAENKTAENPFGLDVKGSTINQTMRRMAKDGWDDQNIQDTIATVYGTNAPTAIEWSYTGE